MSFGRFRDSKFRKNITSRSKAVFLSFLVFISIITTLPLLQTTNASAANRADSNSSNADWQVKSMLYYKAISRCLDAGAYNYSSYWPWDNQDISATNVNSGKWFNNSSSGQPVGIYLKGSLNGVDDEGRVKCGDGALVSSALSLWGLGAVDVICHSGFQGVDLGSNQSIETCQKGTKFELSGDGSTNVDNAGLFRTYIKDQIYGGNEPNLSNAQNYIYYRHTLNQSCIQGIDSSGNQPSSTPASSDNKYGYNGVKWVDSVNKEVLTGSYIGNLKTDTDVILSATDSGRDSSVGVHKTCAEVVGLMNQYADDFLKLLLKDDTAAAAETKAGTNSGNTDQASSCSIDGIGWIICPVVNFLAKIADGAFKYLANNFLSTSASIVSTDSDTYRAWTVMRSIANVAFVIAFLIIIFSQITSVGISNYGIKKLLPRIIIAAILVNLSYFICQIAVDLSNILGYSLQSLLAGLVPPSTGISGTWSGGSFWTNTAGGVIAVGAGAAIAWASLAALIPVLLAAVVALIMILFILVARQALIILLVVLSPLAFVAFLLPNTSDWFKKWQKAFTAMLMLFPIIALVFGASRFASGILTDVFSANEAGDTNNLGQIVSAAILVLPLFVVPGLLKKSLDGVGSLGTKMNGWGEKLGGMAGRKGSEAYGNSRVAQYKKYVGQEDAKRRALIQSGTYSGRGGNYNPRNLMSKMNKGINESKYSGEFGKRALTQGYAIADAQDAEGIKNSTSLLDNMRINGQPLTQAQMMEIALGGDVTNGKTGSERSVLSKAGNFDTYSRIAAVQKAGKIATVSEAHQLLEASADPSNASIRKSIASAIAGSSVVGKAPYLGGKTIGQIEQGTASVNGAALDALKSGKITAESLSVGDPTAISKLVEVASMVGTNDEERADYGKARENLISAYKQFNDPASARLREKVVAGGKLDIELQKIQNLNNTI